MIPTSPLPGNKKQRDKAGGAEPPAKRVGGTPLRGPALLFGSTATRTLPKQFKPFPLLRFQPTSKAPTAIAGERPLS